jgi:hypothetical protein
VIRLDTTLYVSAFDAGWEGHESATYEVMETPHGPLYRGFRRMFDALLGEAEQGIWQGGRPVIEAESWPASRTRKP